MLGPETIKQENELNNVQQLQTPHGVIDFYPEKGVKDVPPLPPEVCEAFRQNSKKLFMAGVHKIYVLPDQQAKNPGESIYIVHMGKLMPQKQKIMKALEFMAKKALPGRTVAWGHASERGGTYASLNPPRVSPHTRSLSLT